MRTNAIRNDWNDHLQGTRETISLRILLLYNLITFATFLCYDYFVLSSVRANLNCLNNWPLLIKLPFLFRRPVLKAWWIMGSPSFPKTHESAPLWISFSTRAKFCRIIASSKGIRADPSIAFAEAPCLRRTDTSRSRSLESAEWMISPSGTLDASMLVARPPSPIGCEVGPPPPRYRIFSLTQSFSWITLLVSFSISFLGTGTVRPDVASKFKTQLISSPYY